MEKPVETAWVGLQVVAVESQAIRKGRARPAVLARLRETLVCVAGRAQQRNSGL